ncbi:hypothetical protein TrST_g12943 [Triparma strigata]|uniref:Uncharacterized protein n=1 Tax=Triparma strigata TaxID=1606541 RepID=A0A9W7EUD5_9STRA|nr:hypothetical protein TrST_g12943 [Triparma strigata]
MMIARSRSLSFAKLKSNEGKNEEEVNDEFHEIQTQNNNDTYKGRKGLRERVGDFFKGVRDRREARRLAILAEEEALRTIETDKFMSSLKSSESRKEKERQVYLESINVSVEEGGLEGKNSYEGDCEEFFRMGKGKEGVHSPVPPSRGAVKR